MDRGKRSYRLQMSTWLVSIRILSITIYYIILSTYYTLNKNLEDDVNFRCNLLINPS